MMRNYSLIACCIALLSATSAVSAQSFGDAPSPARKPNGPDLPSLREFRVDYSSRSSSASFDRRLPELHFDSEEDTGPQWFTPSIEIAGAKVAPDIKHKGLKVAIPTELIHGGGAVAADQGTLPN